MEEKVNGIDLDHGVEFRNFDSPGDWSRPTLDRRVQLFKRHGSLNWLFCPTCNDLEITPAEASRLDHFRHIIPRVMTNLDLKIRSIDADDEYAQASALELRMLIRDESDIAVEAQAPPAQAGSKGDPITLGMLSLTFLTSGAAVALVKVLEAYVSRKRSIEVELARPDGKRLVLKADDVTGEQIKATRSLLNRFFED